MKLLLNLIFVLAFGLGSTAVLAQSIPEKARALLAKPSSSLSERERALLTKIAAMGAQPPTVGLQTQSPGPTRFPSDNVCANHGGPAGVGCNTSACWCDCYDHTSYPSNAQCVTP